MTMKSTDTRRKSPAKILHKNSKKTGSSGRATKVSPEAQLKDQYNIIREDITKLRDDLAKGYDLARNFIDKKGMLRSYLKAR
jgi:hypothetical protein